MEPQDFAPEPTLGVESAPFVLATAPAPAADPEPAIEPEPEPAADPEPTIEPTLDVEGTHIIEHRSFARDSADEPMPVTVITGA